MVTPVLRRRAFCLGALWATALAGRVRADTPVDIGWDDLIPEGQAPLPPQLQGLVQHEGASLASQQPKSTGVRKDWNGRVVRLSGFVVPLDFEGVGVTSFLLVPFVGACIHVPPPPANQLVFVTNTKPYPLKSMFEAVTVTGMFGTASTSTQLAAVAYALSADKVVPYRA